LVDIYGHELPKKFAKFHAKRLNRSENRPIPKSFNAGEGGGYFFETPGIRVTFSLVQLQLLFYYEMRCRGIALSKLTSQFSLYINDFKIHILLTFEVFLNYCTPTS